MPPDIAARPFDLPSVSYGPFRLLEAVPWLMLAAALRIFAAGRSPAIQVACTIIESFAICLAFFLAARRMIEFADGRTNLGNLSFREQLAAASKIVLYAFVLLFAAALILFLVGARQLAPYLFLGFDGMAFDQFSKAGRVWSGILAGIVFLMVVQIGDGRDVALIGALKEFAKRSAWMIPAIALVAGFQLALSYGQGLVRHGLVLALTASPMSERMKVTIFFFFVVAFATIRLWGSLVILTFALRESYRRDAPIKSKVVGQFEEEIAGKIRLEAKTTLRFLLKLTAIVFLSVCGLFIAYQAAAYWSAPPYPLNLAIGNDRSPEENMELIVRNCPRGDKEFCHCFVKKVYSETSRAERVLYLRWDSFVHRRSIRLGARKLSLSDDDLQHMLESARRKITGISGSCAR